MNDYLRQNPAYSFTLNWRGLRFTSRPGVWWESMKGTIMSEDTVMGVGISKVMDKLKAVQQLLSSDPKLSYEILCAAQRGLDEVALTLLDKISL